MNYGIGNPKGEKGKDGVSPNISVNANVNNSVGTPSVSVVKSGTNSNPVFTFNFQNLKGETGTTTIKTQIVNSLPSTGDTDTIYFVANNSGESENLYNEYLYVNNAWERVDSKIDLSNYIQKSNTSGLVKNDGTIDTTQYAKASDITPVLLWENPSPTTAFGETEITLNETLQIGDFLAIEWKQSANSPLSYVQRFRIFDFSNVETITALFLNAYYNGTMYSVSRQIKIPSGSKIIFQNNYSNTILDNTTCIPVRVYKVNSF